MNRSIKTEHAGAKNGGGSYGHRVDVKQVSRKLRRASERVDVASLTTEAIADLQDPTYLRGCRCGLVNCPIDGDANP